MASMMACSRAKVSASWNSASTWCMRSRRIFIRRATQTATATGRMSKATDRMVANPVDRDGAVADQRWHTRGMARPKPSPRLIAALAVAHVVVTTLVWRDLRRRTDDQVRGSKRLWRVASMANMSNSVVYVLIGRKRSEQQPTSP
jgi:hypothetical protein